MALCYKSEKTHRDIMTYSLGTLLAPELHILIPQDTHKTPISSVTADSRKVKKDTLFVAVLGRQNDGFSYIDKAIASGAHVIMCHVNHPYKDAIKKYKNILFIPVPDPRYHLSLMLTEINQPLPEHMAAVTGTNGKTSVADFARQLLEHNDIKAASIGTLGIVTKDKIIDHGHTTPDPEILYPALKALKEDGIDHVIFEASSHGLEQGRLHGLSFKTSAFTNFTQDHLDYHANIESYFDAKALLFNDLTTRGGMVTLYSDDPRSDDVINACQRAELNTTTIGRDADISIVKTDTTVTGQNVIVKIHNKEHQIHLPLSGSFQAINALIAAGLAASLTHKDISDYLHDLEHLKTVDGRMDLVAEYKGAAIYVDYAHTPDALEKALQALRPHTEKRILVIFGCGGDRDKTKRPLMGKAAEDYADIAIITDDNPRSETPENIHKDILKGCIKPENMLIIPSRETAFAKALDLLEKDDILLVAGKGHEEGQIIGDIKHPFKDATVITRLIQAPPCLEE